MLRTADSARARGGLDLACIFGSVPSISDNRFGNRLRTTDEMAEFRHSADLRDVTSQSCLNRNRSGATQ